MNTNFKFKELTDLIFATSVDFKEKAEQIYKSRDNAISDIERKYKDDAPERKQEIQQAKQKADESIAILRVQCSKGVISLANEIEQKETEAMRYINSDNLAKIKAISDLPLTIAELQVLNEKYCNNDYWASRALAEIAEKNAVTASSVGIMPSYDAKMNILHKCVEHFNAFIKDYKLHDTGRLKNNEELLLEVGVSSDVMNRAYSMYAGETVNISDVDVVSKALMILATKRTDVEKGLAIGNILRNTQNKQAVRDKLICEISLDADVSDLAIEMSGYRDEIVKFKTDKAKLYKEAEKAIDTIKNNKDKEFIEMRIAENQDNDFFVDMMHSESKRDNTIREIWSGHTIREVVNNSITE